MEDTTVPTALYVLGAIGGLSVICIGVLIAVLQSPDVAALAVLASIASGAEGGPCGRGVIIPATPPSAPRTDGSEKQLPPEGAERTSGTER
jgi:hypothetical protein